MITRGKERHGAPGQPGAVLGLQPPPLAFWGMRELRPAPLTSLMTWSLCLISSWICRREFTLVSSSSCFCVLASAMQVR